MRRISFVDNFKNFLVSNPPGVIFLVCILTFIVILSSLMDHINRNQIRNPDELDWNAFKRKMAELDYCFKYPSKTSENNAKNDDSFFIIDKSKKSYSYPVVFNMHFDGNKTELEAINFFSGTIDGYLIGLDKEKFDVNFEIGETSTIYDEECTKNILLGKSCYKYTITGCLTFSGFSKFFKKTKSPNLCGRNFHKLEKNKSLNETSSSFLTFKETPEFSQHYWCPSTYGSIAKLKYNADLSLIPFLNSNDKKLIQTNLKNSIFFLSVILVSILLILLLRNVRKKTNYVNTENQM